MAEKTETPFEAWNFDDEGERVRACTFTDLQTKYLKTELAMAMAEKMTIALDPSDGSEAHRIFAFKHEYLRGRIEQLAFLLGVSKDNKDALAAFFKMQQAKQAVG